MVNLSTLIIALFLTIVLVPFFRALAFKLNALDNPDERKVHVRPMARTGGLAMALGALVPLVLWAPPDPLLRFLLFASLIIVGAGFVDDIVGLGAPAKFGAQVLAATVIIVFGGVKIQSLGVLLPESWLLPAWLSIPFTLLVIVGVTNAINLADGLDGLAGGISIIAFIVLGYLGFQVGDSLVTLVAVAVIGAIFGFLRFNTYPATIFMGDAGSQMLGFLAIVLAIKLTQNNAALTPSLPLLLLGFPILDTFTVMLARIYHGHSPFKADKNHFHHKLMRLGLRHSEAVLTIYLLQLLLVLSAYEMRYCSDWLIVGGYLIFCAVVTLFFFLSAKFKWSIKRRQDGELDLLQRRLEELNKLTLILKIIFRLLQTNFILVLLILILSVRSVPGWQAGIAFALAAFLIVGLIKSDLHRYQNFCLRLGVYLTLPVFVYGRAVEKYHSVNCPWWNDCHFYYNLVYFTLIFLSLLLLKFTRRSGYKSTPLDFLILGIAFLIPALFPQSITGVSMGMVVVKIMALFFAFEVIIEESRKRNWSLEIAVIFSLLLTGLKYWMI